eukprot:910346-Amphidinium_carterae.2
METRKLQELIKSWRRTHNDNEEPKSVVEANGEQISALSATLATGLCPWAHFAVWRPHYMRFAKKLRAPWSGGTWVSKEVPGPSNYGEWLRCWKLLRFALKVLGAVGRNGLTRCSKRVQKLPEGYPKYWEVVAEVEQKMRLEYMERIRRKREEIQKERTDAGLQLEYRVEQPWDKVFKQAARDTVYWNTEVDRKILN